jgi:hypothetical protein
MISSIPFYGSIKDLIIWWKWKEKEKEVGLNYNFEKDLSYDYRWERPDTIQERFQDGFEYYFEEDKIKRIRYILVCKNKGVVELILIKKSLS